MGRTSVRQVGDLPLEPCGVEAALGRVLLETSGRHYAVMLLAGLVAVLVAVNIPFVGGLINLLLTILGLGLLAELVYRGMSRVRAEAVTG